MGTPRAEIEIDADLVRSLVVSQHPDLASLPLVELASGWDNTLWRLGDDLVVRLPCRAAGAPLALNEQRWLPVLAPRLPLPVPAAVRTGRPTHEYPWHWSVVPWIDGVPGDRAVLSNPPDAARRLGEFLAALHHRAAPDAPYNPYRGVPLRERDGSFHERLADLDGHVDAPRLAALWSAAVDAADWGDAPVWLHGDLHPANTVVAHGTLAGVVDFGDMCGGDPATDIAGAWMLLPRESWPQFVDAYGGLDPDLERRSVGWALLFALMLLHIGLTDPRPTYATVGRATIERVLAHSSVDR